MLLRKINREIEAEFILKRSDCDVTNYVFQNFNNVNIERLKIDGKTTTHRITFNSIDDTEMALQEIRKITSFTLRSGNKTIWAKSSCCSACFVIGISDSVILGSKAINSTTVSYRLLFQNYAKLLEMKHKLEMNSIEYSIANIDFKDTSGLTSREAEILVRLYEGGYFDQERKLTMTQIAEQLNISTAALSEILRKTLRKVVKEYIENKL